MSRALHAAYGALLSWLGYCTFQTVRTGDHAAAATFAAAAVFTVIATLREGQLEDALRREAVHAERNARTARPPLDTTECAAALALAGACCERWWTSCGTNHDPTCPTSPSPAT
ncbi:hypothetical protein [Streptomyces aureocirculatus]|uniref:hypothetical protein n=1 Tax=Streptomyces aureocirculatus TaxID=67275 RepID=UPI00056C4A31|nr:hypothetical protein [Streptomyces aureocirculatus]